MLNEKISIYYINQNENENKNNEFHNEKIRLLHYYYI